MQKKKKANECPFPIFPNYKWCGPGCSGPGVPFNDVDACCQRHDRCLQKGKSCCSCDFEFLKCLRPKMDRNTPKGNHASLIYHAMKLKIFFNCNRF